MSADFDAIYQEEDELAEITVSLDDMRLVVPDPIVIQGAGNMTVLVEDVPFQRRTGIIPLSPVSDLALAINSTPSSLLDSCPVSLLRSFVLRWPASTVC